MVTLPRMTLFFVAILTIVITTWITLARLGGVDQAMISDMYPTSITPAGYVFAIWSLIYASWISVGIFAWRSSPSEHFLARMWQKYFGAHENIMLTTRETVLFSSTMLFTAIWLVPWHFDFLGISVVVMLILLGGLFWLFFSSFRAPRWFQYAVQLFLGWIIVATLANISVWCVSRGWLASDSQLWAWCILSGAFLLNLFFLIRYRTWIMMGVFVWALVGILIK